MLDSLRKEKPPAAGASADQREFHHAGKNCGPSRRWPCSRWPNGAAADHRPSLVYQLVTEAAREDVDFKPAWRFLGYVRQGGAWRTPFEIKQLAAGKIWSQQFGWIAASHVAAYQNGQRFYRQAWMTAAEENRLAQQHSRWLAPWRPIITW